MIIFISEINALSTDTTSTHILTENILYGLKQNKQNIIFLALCETDNALTNTKAYYTKKVDTLYTIKSSFTHSKNKYKRLFSMIKGILFPHIYTNMLPNNIEINDDTIIISHTPSIEAAYLSKALTRKNKNIRYIQYWSDPISLSGILPENYSFKRFPFSLIEKHCYSFSTEIVFGTKTLYTMLSTFHHKYSHKMRWVDFSYSPKQAPQAPATKSNKHFIYAGNYYHTIRDILPLYEAFNELSDDYHLDIYGSGDLILNNSINVTIHERVSPKELETIESKYKASISLLNHSCLQLPGKTFYQMDTDQNILVIADGEYSQEIIEYLESFKRFFISKNKKNSIKEAIKTIGNISNYKCPDHIKHSFSPKSISDTIINGIIQ